MSTSNQATPGFNHSIPDKILTPNKVETSIGGLEFFVGQIPLAVGRQFDFRTELGLALADVADDKPCKRQQHNRADDVREGSLCGHVCGNQHVMAPLLLMIVKSF